MRIVLDSNVLLSALFSHGLCESLFDECFLSPRLILYTSEAILREFRDRAVSKFHIPTEEADSTADFLRTHSNVIEPAPVTPEACRDPNDLPVLGTAQAVTADFLVTGDKDLIVFKRFGKTEIVSPRQFYEMLMA